MKRTSILLLLALLMAQANAQRVYRASDFGIRPGTGKNASPLVVKMLAKIKADTPHTEAVTIRFEEGTYHFHEKGSATREYYISNHDQDNPKHVAFPLEDMNNVTLDGGGANFIFHGRMLPVALLRSEDCTLQNFSIDFENPHIAQLTVTGCSPDEGVTFEPAPWVKYTITPDSLFRTTGDGWAIQASYGIAFDGATRHIVPQTSDIHCPLRGVREVSPRRLLAPAWRDTRLQPGTVVALRGWGRPTPGIFLSQDKNTCIYNIKVHYAEGMGLLAQLCENITLDGFCVCLRGDNDPRYFTTQADATHFSGCKGRIISRAGLYEGMMDDAINVHGTYLKVISRTDSRTLVCRYMHDQSWGFRWGEPGDTVQFICSRTMQTEGEPNVIETIRPHGTDTEHGAREFQITFTQAVPDAVDPATGFGVENLTWTPEVTFTGNTVRNNRARGALFSTPRRTIVEDNTFDHTSGTAILLCGDCNGWFETGACRDVQIRHNRFINALTSMFQFTSAVISIYPEIPDLDAQTRYFHSGIVIEDNEFDTFDHPILYAKSVDGLTFRHNVIRTNTDFTPFHENKARFLLEHVTNVKIE